jgi:hypothetical protein
MELRHFRQQRELAVATAAAHVGELDGIVAGEASVAELRPLLVAYSPYGDSWSNRFQERIVWKSHVYPTGR